MDLFKQFLPIFFSRNEQFKKLNNNIRGKHFFMVNRFVSIKFPHIANSFNHLNINTGQVINSYHDMFQNIGSTPHWIWNGIKGQKKSKEKRVINEEIQQKFCELFDISYKEFERLEQLYPEELYDEIKDIQESLNNDIRKL